MRDQGLGSWPARRRRSSPGRTAIAFGDAAWTYAELDDRCLRLALALRELGVERGDRVAYLGRNHPALLETLFASSRLGAVFVPLNWRLTVSELAYVTGDAAPAVLVHAPDMAEVAAAIAADATTDLRRTVAVGEGLEALIARTAAAPLDEHIALDDPAVIIYTSGTTGRPKGATLSHGNVTWNCVNALIDTELQSDEVALVSAPLFHVAALNMVSMPMVMKGGTIVLTEQFDPSEALDLIDRLGVTVMFGVPAMFNAMAQAPGWEAAKLTSLRRLLCGGAPVPRSTIDLYLQRGVVFLQGYGLTETSPGALFLAAERAVDKAGTAGVASFFTDVRVVRPDGTDVAPGEKGEVVIAGPNVMLGYWNRPEATAEVMTDGWLHSGDVAVVDDDGYVTIVDRLKDMIISGGENIYPAEVEDAFYSHPAVSECGVIGVPDERWGEVPLAVVVLRDGCAADAAELLDHVGARIARYKVPKSVVFRDSLPRSGAGKVLKARLRAELEAS